jgi:hypothetical protein
MPPKKRGAARNSSSDSSRSKSPAEKNTRRRYSIKFKTLLFQKIKENHDVLFAKWKVGTSKVPIMKAWQTILEYALSIQADCFKDSLDLQHMFGIWKRAARYTQ